MSTLSNPRWFDAAKTGVIFDTEVDGVPSARLVRQGDAETAADFEGAVAGEYGEIGAYAPRASMVFAQMMEEVHRVVTGMIDKLPRGELRRTINEGVFALVGQLQQKQGFVRTVEDVRNVAAFARQGIDALATETGQYPPDSLRIKDLGD
jgi:hypothetical protein